jgi:peptidoglycan/LPS O-acetylase OafA/YrhL
VTDSATAERLKTVPSTGSRLPGIEGLRAIAACSIVAVHVWSSSMPDGEVLWNGHRLANAVSTLSVGLTLYFTLSGFLLYRPFAAAIARGTQGQTFSAYLQNRFLRIAPAYWVILLVTALVVAAAGIRTAGGELAVGRLTDPLELAQAALLVQDYRPDTMIIGIGPAWSLAVEVAFYLTLPLLVLMGRGLARRASDRRGRVLALLAPPALLLLIGLTGKLAAAHLLPAHMLAGYNTDWHSVIERSFWAQADLFAFGMVVAVLHGEVRDGRIQLPDRWRLMAGVGALVVFLPCAWTMRRGEHSYLLQNTGEALALALALAAIVIPERSQARQPWTLRVLESPAFVVVGVASYSLFLWHYPVILWLREQGLTAAGGWGALAFNLLLVAVVAGALSALTYRYVERPALRHKRRGRQSPAPAQDRLTTAPAAAPALASANEAAIRR